MSLQQEISKELNDSLVGKKMEVLVDEKDREAPDLYYARTQGDAPEVDGQVMIHSASPLNLGTFLKVRITDALEYDLVGELA